MRLARSGEQQVVASMVPPRSVGKPDDGKGEIFRFHIVHNRIEMSVFDFCDFARHPDQLIQRVNA